MRVGLQAALGDVNLDAAQASSQRQLAVSLSAIADVSDRTAPLNLCLILDHSGSMNGRAMETVKQAAQHIVDSLSPGDRLSIVVFDHRAKVLVPNQVIDNPASIKRDIQQIQANGGTAIDEGMRLGIEELAKGKKDSISQAFLLTDGENEHGDNSRCLKLAGLAANYSITLNTLGFGDRWNQDILEKIADAGGGSLSYIQQPEAAVREFSRLFSRIQSVGLTNAHLMFSLPPQVSLAELKPIAQVVPDTIELAALQEEGQFLVRLGDLMTDSPRVVLANLYIQQLPEGIHPIAQVQVRYDDPMTGRIGLLSESIPIEATALAALSAVLSMPRCSSIYPGASKISPDSNCRNQTSAGRSRWGCHHAAICRQNCPPDGRSKCGYGAATKCHAPPVWRRFVGCRSQENADRLQNNPCFRSGKNEAILR